MLAQPDVNESSTRLLCYGTTAPLADLYHSEFFQGLHPSSACTLSQTRTLKLNYRTPRLIILLSPVVRWILDAIDSNVVFRLVVVASSSCRRRCRT
jgi:hypothetical protein